jgi:restriction system protein
MTKYDPGEMDWLPVDSATPALIEHWRRQRATHHVRAHDSLSVNVSESVSLEVPTGTLALDSQAPAVTQYPDVLVQATVVMFGDRRTEGQVIAGLAVPWFEIIAQLARDPEWLFRIPWRQLEEIIAGAYHRAGWPDVVLTPRSGDRGRDVIATRLGVASIRIIDQIKAYKPGHVVTADEVRSMLGVLAAEPNVSKGLITTTSRFAPGIENNSALTAFMPHRLELKNGDQLRQWLLELGSIGQGDSESGAVQPRAGARGTVESNVPRLGARSLCLESERDEKNSHIHRDRHCVVLFPIGFAE